jgi:hypothetical protein
MEYYVSYHKIINFFQEIQQNSPRLKTTGHGDIVYFSENITGDTTAVYPYMFITPELITYQESTTEYQFNIIFADIVNTDLSNEIDVISDMSIECKNFIAQIYRGFLFDKIDITLGEVAVPFMERFNDHVGGVYCTMTIIVFDDINACVEYPTPTPTPTQTPTNTPTPSITPTLSLTPTNTQTPTVTPTNTQTPTPSTTTTLTPTPTTTTTLTPTPTQTGASGFRMYVIGNQKNGACSVGTMGVQYRDINGNYVIQNLGLSGDIGYMTVVSYASYPPRWFNGSSIAQFDLYDLGVYDPNLCYTFQWDSYCYTTPNKNINYVDCNGNNQTISAPGNTFGTFTGKTFSTQNKIGVEYLIPVPTPTPTPTATVTPTVTPTLSLTPTNTPSVTPTLSLTPTNTQTPTKTSTPTASPQPIIGNYITGYTSFNSSTSAITLNNVFYSGSGLIVIAVNVWSNTVSTAGQYENSVYDIIIDGVSSVSNSRIYRSADTRQAEDATISEAIAYIRLLSGSVISELKIVTSSPSYLINNMTVGIYRIQNNISDTPYNSVAQIGTGVNSTISISPLQSNSIGVLATINSSNTAPTYTSVSSGTLTSNSVNTLATGFGNFCSQRLGLYKNTSSAASLSITQNMHPAPLVLPRSTLFVIWR